MLEVNDQQLITTKPSMGFTPWLMVVLALLAVILGFNYKYRPWARQEKVAEEMVAPPPAAPTPTPISSLSPAEKVGQILAFPTVLIDENPLASESAELAVLTTIKPGVVIIFGANVAVEEVKALRRALATASTDWPIKPLLAVDHEGGLVQRLNGVGFTRLASWQALCALPDAKRQTAFAQTAEELATVGIKIVFGPVVDLAGEDGLLKSRTCSDRVDSLVLLSNDLIDAYKNNGILATIKHFPGIGSASVDFHHTFQTLSLKAEDIEPFRQLLTLQSDLAVMISHAGITDYYEGPCSLTAACVGSLAEQHPNALIISDALDMKAVFAQTETGNSVKTLPEAATAAVKAGNHLLVFGQGVSAEQMTKVHQHLLEIYQTDPDFAVKIDRAVEKITYYRTLDWFNSDKMLH